MALTIEYIELTEILHYEKNARTHSPEQIEQLVNSINEFGFTNPVLIDENNELIAGHGRSTAAAEIGMDKIPCVRLTGLSEDQKKALRISDNQLALNAGWDLDMLADEISDLDLEGFNLDLIGFDSEFLDNLLSDDESEAMEEMPELPNGDKEEFQNKTFILHDKQAKSVDDAITLAKSLPHVNTGLNENGNGNAIALICKEWLEGRNGKR